MTSGPQKIPERIASAREAIDAALIANQYDSEETATLNDALRALAVLEVDPGIGQKTGVSAVEYLVQFIRETGGPRSWS